MPDDLNTLVARGNEGDAAAQYQLGNVFHAGLLGQTIDLDQAITWYQRAMDQDHADAAFNLGVIGLRQLNPPRPDIAVPALEKAHALGDEQSTRLLAETLIKGEGGVIRDAGRGLRMLETAARDGSLAAMNLVGVYLRDGSHVEQDQRRANAWFQRAAKKKDASGRYYLGVSLMEGLGISQDETLARKLFLAAAKQGNVGAMYNYAAALINGRGGDVELEEGNRWLFKAAEEGDADAQYAAAESCRQGKGIPRDESAAFRWYSLAAEQDHTDALFCLGLCLEHGIGTEPNGPACEQAYTRAAMAGHSGASHNLAAMYARGDAIPRNLGLARELFMGAISAGNDDALFSMGLFEANSGNAEEAYMWGLLSVTAQPQGQGQALLDHVEAQLDDQQKAAARQRADTWERPDVALAFHVQRLQ